MLTLTLRGLRSHKRRLVGTVLAVLLGVGFMAGSLIFTDTMRASFSGVYADAERDTDALVRGPATIDAYTGTQRAPVDAALIERVAAVPGVAGVASRVEGFAQVLDADGKTVDDISAGAAPAGAAWTDVDALNPFDLVAGRGPRTSDEVVIDRSLADEVDLAPGDGTTVLTASGPVDVKVVGIATFGDADNRAGNRTVLFPLETAQELLGRTGTVDSIAVETADGVSQAQVAKAIDAALGDDVETITGAALTEENSNRKNEDVDFFGTFMQVFAAIALLIGAFIINNTFAILIAQRTKELALLRAIGASARQVRRSVALEATVVGIIASAAGLLVGIGVAQGIKTLWQSFGITLPEGPLVISSTSLLMAFAVGVVVTVGSALLPARRAAKVAPVAAMRDTAVESTRPSRRRIVLGLFLTVASVVSVVGGIQSGNVPMVLLGALAGFLGVATLSPVLARPVMRVLAVALPRLAGIRGLLARENARRNPKRTAATASALMIGVALVGAITVFAASGKWSVTHSFDEEFRGDLTVDSGAWTYGGFSPDLADQLSAAKHVEVAVPQRFTQAKVGEGVSEISAWPADTVEQAFDLGVSAGSLADMGEDGLAISSKHAEDKGYQIGSRVPVTFGTGVERDLVVRVLFDHPDWTGQFWVDRSLLAEADAASLDTSIYIRGTEGADPSALRASVEAVTAPYGNLDVRDRDQTRTDIASEFNAMLGFVYALLALAILIALVGIANTVSLSVIERTRELGLLRAVGMSRGHLRAMVRWEAALVAVYGTVLGLGIGLFLGWALVFAIKESGIETAKTVVPIGQLALIVAIAGSCGVLAALLPARRAARLDILDAVSTT